MMINVLTVLRYRDTSHVKWSLKTCLLNRFVVGSLKSENVFRFNASDYSNPFKEKNNDEGYLQHRHRRRDRLLRYHDHPQLFHQSCHGRCQRNAGHRRRTVGHTPRRAPRKQV